MIRCRYCQSMNMRDDETRGTCYQCGGSLGRNTSAAVNWNSLTTGAEPRQLTGTDRLLCQIALVLGGLCFATCAFAVYKGVTYPMGIQSAEATNRRDFKAAYTVHGVFGQGYQVGQHYSYAVFNFEGRTYRIHDDGRGPGERFTVYFRPENPQHTIAPTCPSNWWFAGGAAMVGLFLVAVGGGALYLMRPRGEPAALHLQRQAAAK